MGDTTAATIARKKINEEKRLDRIKTALSQLPESSKDSFLKLIQPTPIEAAPQEEKESEIEEETTVEPPKNYKDNEITTYESIKNAYEKFMLNNPSFQRTVFKPIYKVEMVEPQFEEQPIEQPPPENLKPTNEEPIKEAKQEPPVSVETVHPDNSPSFLRTLSTTGIQIAGALIIFFITAATKSLSRPPKTEQATAEVRDRFIYVDQPTDQHSFMFMK
jgi:hypothetical protein